MEDKKDSTLSKAVDAVASVFKDEPAKSEAPKAKESPKAKAKPREVHSEQVIHLPNGKTLNKGDNQLNAADVEVCEQNKFVQKLFELGMLKWTK